MSAAEAAPPKAVATIKPANKLLMRLTPPGKDEYDALVLLVVRESCDGDTTLDDFNAVIAKA
jgi:hypothetical protein